ncbi:MAG: tRNA (cytidine(34)-2'-O)-methyltransferase [Alphaproteobacteria bacterium]|nr:tRNA (cytidine(34)-2'-O)-methyltransferase [Alphaproteobacteria bacterium]
MRLALYQPEIPQNAGTLLRLGACLGVEIDIIEPCGFAFTDRLFLRAGLDYLPRATYYRHDSWDAFLTARPPGARLVLLSTRASQSYVSLAFRPTDILLLGRETEGVPESIHATADERVRVPMRAGLRSLNVAVAGAMVLGEALRQTVAFPTDLGH